MAFTRNRKSSNDVPAKSSSNRTPQLRDLLGCIEWPKKAKFITARAYPGVVPVAVHMLPLFKDGEPMISTKSNKQIEIPKICLAFDPDTQENDADKECPYCDAALYRKVEYWIEAVVREEQDAEPAKHRPSKEEEKTGIKDKDNDSSWTPVRCFRLTGKVYDRYRGLAQLNKVKVDGERVAKPVDDEEYGCDMSMNFDPDGTGDGMYGIQKGESISITDEENELLRWDIEAAILAATESVDAATRDVAQYNKYAGGGGAADSDDDYSPEEGDDVVVTTEDDEEFTGTVLSSTTKVLKIEDADGEEHVFKWANLETVVKAAPKRKAKPAPAADKKAAAKKAPAKPALPDDDEDGFSEGDEVRVMSDDDEELFAGTITEIDARTVSVENEDGKEKTFKLVNVTLEAAEEEKPAPKAKGKGRAAPEPEDDPDDEEFTPDEGDEVEVLDGDDDVLATGTVTSIDKRSITIEDDDGEEQTFKMAKVTLRKPAPKKKAAPKASAKSKAKPAPADDDDDDDDVPVKPKPAAKGKRTYDFD